MIEQKNLTINFVQTEKSNGLNRQKFIQWIATALLFGGALLISAIPAIAIGWQVFMTFLLGHSLWLGDSFKTKHYPMVALNTSFLILDIYAIAIRII